MPARISILIPAFNEERLLGATLEAVRDAATRAFDPRGWAWEWIVCDNNSTDGTAAIARAAGARVVFEPVNQIARARDAAAAAATGEWLLFIDADTHPPAALLDDAARCIEDIRPLAAGATIRMDAGGAKARVICALWNTLGRLLRQPAGSFILVEAATFRAAGGFGTDWFAAEEIGLLARLRRHARGDARRVVILHRHPVLTSGRKLVSHSLWEMLRVVLAAALSGGGSLRGRSGTGLWYERRD